MTLKQRKHSVLKNEVSLPDETIKAILHRAAELSVQERALTSSETDKPLYDLMTFEDLFDIANEANISNEYVRQALGEYQVRVKRRKQTKLSVHKKSDKPKFCLLTEEQAIATFTIVGLVYLICYLILGLGIVATLASAVTGILVWLLFEQVNK